jgi:hypothetical protein
MSISSLVQRVSPRGPIDDYVVEDHADHILATFKTQREAIEWAKKNVYYFAVVDLTLALGLYQPIAALSATPTALLAESPFSVFPPRGPSNRFFCRGDQARPEICAFSNLKEQTATFRDWSKATAHLGAAMSRKPTGSRYSPHQQATKPGQLPNVLQQDLRAYFELARGLPHSMLTLLMQLTNRRSTSRPKRRGRTKRR